MTRVHIHIHRRTADAGFDESKHPRDGGKFATKAGGGRGGNIDRAQAEHARRTGQALSRHAAARQVAENQPAKRPSLRVSVAAKNAMHEHQLRQRAMMALEAKGDPEKELRLELMELEEEMDKHPRGSLERGKLDIKYRELEKKIVAAQKAKAARK